MPDISELPPEYEYQEIILDDGQAILTRFRTKEDIEKWMTDLQTLTKETWTIEKTYKVNCNSPRNLFKRIYRCHFRTSVKNKETEHSENETGAKKRKKKSRNIDCKAKVIVTIKKIFEVSKSKKQAHLSEEWPCVIKFQQSHNHRTDVVEALRERPVGDEAKRHLMELFNRGHSAASAYHTFCAEKMAEYGDDYENILYDSAYKAEKRGGGRGEARRGAGGSGAGAGAATSGAAGAVAAPPAADAQLARRYNDMAPKHWEEGPPRYLGPTEYERPPPYYYPGPNDRQ